MSLSIDVGNHWNLRSTDFDFRKNFRQRLIGRSHNFRVEGSGNRERNCSTTSSDGQLGRAFAGGVFSADHKITRTQKVGDLNRTMSRRLFADLLNLRTLHQQNADHSRRSGIGRCLHRLTAALDDS